MEITLAVVGSRQFDDYEFFCKTMDKYVAFFDYDIKKVYSGDAPGVDQMAEDWAISRGHHFEPVLAVWENPDGTHNPGAGYARNEKLLNKITHAVIFWDGGSKGTDHTRSRAKELNKTYVTVPIIATKRRYYCARWKEIYAERNKEK